MADTQNEALLSRKAYKTVQLVFTQKWPLGGADGFPPFSRLFLASHNSLTNHILQPEVQYNVKVRRV